MFRRQIVSCDSPWPVTHYLLSSQVEDVSPNQDAKRNAGQAGRQAAGTVQALLELEKRSLERPCLALPGLATHRLAFRHP